MKHLGIIGIHRGSSGRGDAPIAAALVLIPAWQVVLDPARASAIDRRAAADLELPLGERPRLKVDWLGGVDVGEFEHGAQRRLVLLGGDLGAVRGRRSGFA
jgi:hypothetical protein